MQPKPQLGPFRAHDIRPGDRHELSEGNAIYCAPTGGTGARGTGYGFELLDSDPAVDSAGVDAGFTPSSTTLRAPDVSVGVPDEPGWIQGAPPLALEYAGTGQDEASLQTKITELLEAGTRWVWVIRLVGPRRVEVYERGKATVTKSHGDVLTAPGVLKNAVPAEALWNRQSAHAATLRNLLQRAGYESLDAVLEVGRAEGIEVGHEAGRAEGIEIGRAEGALLFALSGRGWTITDAHRTQIQACRDLSQLQLWLSRATTGASLDDVFAA
jgi:hypothetical protein